MIETNNQPKTEVKTEETINSVPLTAPEVTPEVKEEIIPEVKKEVKAKTAPKTPKAKVEVKKEKPLVDTALVMKGKIEVRKYSIKDHGEDFIELANEFASKKEYQVVTLKEIIKSDASDIPQEDPENVVVVKKNGLTVRTYSLSVHGEDFKKLAKQFAEKNDYQI